MLEIFAGNGSLQVLFELGEFGGMVLGSAEGLWHFPLVGGAFVHGLEHPSETFGKHLVTIGATKPTGFFEISLGKPAGLTLQLATFRLAGLLHLMGRAKTEQNVGEIEARRVAETLLLRTRFAQVDLLDLPLGQFCVVNLGLFLFTHDADHDGFSMNRVGTA